jgi:hypothetical protein
MALINFFKPLYGPIFTKFKKCIIIVIETSIRSFKMKVVIVTIALMMGMVIALMVACSVGVYMEDSRIEAACITTKDVHFELRGKQYYCMDDAQVDNLVQQIIKKLMEGSKDSSLRGA